MKKNKIVYAGLVTLLSITLAACGNGDSAKTNESSSKGSESTALAAKQEFTINTPQEMPSADPSLSTDVVGGEAITNTYEGLYRLDANNKPTPAGATELATKSEDGLTYTFKLRKEAKWSNGDPVTAKDYVYGWQRTVDPATASEYAYIFEPVKNAAAITAGEKDKSELGIKAINDYELEVTLDKATPYFENLMSFTTFFPQNQKVVEKFGKDFAAKSENAVYNGPFVLADFDGPGTDTQWAYVKNDKYWDAKNVKIDRINVDVVKESSTSLNLFQDGKADDIILTGELAQQMANDPQFISEKQAGTYYFELNQAKADSPFKNENLRKAISYSIDRDALVNNILGDGSVASTGLVPTELAANPKTDKDFSAESGSHVKFDKKEAVAYWDKAKKELGIDSLKFSILSSDTDSSKKIVEYIQGAVQEALPGVKVDVQPVPFSVRLDRSNKGDFDVVLGGWSADYADPSSFLDLFESTNSYNRGKYNNPEYDKNIKEAAGVNVGDPEKRWDNLLAADKTIMGEMGIIPLYQKAEAHLRNEKIKDVAIHPAGAHHDYKWAFMTE